MTPHGPSATKNQRSRTTFRVNVPNVGRSAWAMLSRPRPTHPERLWYFPTMTAETPPPALRLGTDAPVSAAPSLARRHARALYRPVPPVGYDDEGHPECDSATSASDIHERLRSYAVSALQDRYRSEPGFYAAADMALLFERGNRAAVMAPDLLVALDAGPGLRSSYKLWQEPVPDLVLELLSPKTWRRDVEVKPRLYEDLGVREFWLFDPLDKLPRPVNGWRLDGGGAYAPVPTLPDGGCRSAVLGLDLVACRGGYRFRDPATGKLLLNPLEEASARRAAETARDEEASARQAAERARDEEASARQAAERARDEEASARRAAETARQAAEARVAHLEALLRDRDVPPNST